MDEPRRTLLKGVGIAVATVTGIVVVCNVADWPLKPVLDAFSAVAWAVAAVLMAVNLRNIKRRRPKR